MLWNVCWNLSFTEFGGTSNGYSNGFNGFHSGSNGYSTTQLPPPSSKTLPEAIENMKLTVSEIFLS